MKRKGSAVWEGSLKEGKGSVSTESGVLDNARYGFGTRFGTDKGTNPEELLGAAHAACFSMALSAELGRAQMTPVAIRTTSTVTLEKAGEGFGIPAVHLDVTVEMPGADRAAFEAAAASAKVNCPVSKLFNATITMDAKLVS